MAVTAINFLSTSREAAAFIEANPGYMNISEIIPFKNLAGPGGVPIYQDGTLIGALGVAGPDPDQCENIAIAAISNCGGSVETS